jgi:hypothetical protein
VPSIATLPGISHNSNPMMSRLLRVLLLLLWLELGFALILLPWWPPGVWESNYFLYQYPGLGLFANNPFVRGAVSGLGLMNVLLALEAFRIRISAVAARS